MGALKPQINSKYYESQQITCACATLVCIFLIIGLHIVLVNILHSHMFCYIHISIFIYVDFIIFLGFLIFLYIGFYQKLQLTLKILKWLNFFQCIETRNEFFKFCYSCCHLLGLQNGQGTPLCQIYTHPSLGSTAYL